MSLRGSVDLALRLRAWLKRHQRITAAASPVKVNLGSGLAVAAGWINVDSGIYALAARLPTLFLDILYRNSTSHLYYTREQYLHTLRAGHFVHHALEYGVPFHAETVDYIYSSHMLEHLFREDAQALLRDAHRVLRSGGTIRIAVPDLTYALQLYHQGLSEQAMAFFFSLRREGWLAQHHYMYDFELLAQLLATAGFTQIERCAFQSGRCPDLEILDNRPEETLYVEASK